MEEKKQYAILKSAVEYVPLVAFFVGYFWRGLFFATIVLMVLSVVLSVVYFVVARRISVQSLVTLIVICIFGGLTLVFKDERFIKMKPTIIQLAFAVILWVGLLFKRLWLKNVMVSVEMEDKYWYTLTYRFIGFFIISALLNELVWRTQTTEFWVVYKIFGVLGLSFIFFLLQMPFMIKHGRVGHEKK